MIAAAPLPGAAFGRPAALAALVLVFALFAMARPIDHDESQYVAAAVLSGEGLLPYRDYAYLQTPLQPLLFGSVAKLLGAYAYPGLRLINAVLGALAVMFVYRAARAAAVGVRPALIAAGLFAATDILLFGTGSARNDALPVALLAGALWLIIAGEGRRRTPLAAFCAGLLLAAAAATKASYALPAAAYGAWTLLDRAHRPLWVAVGAALPTALVLGLASLAPEAFRFGVFTFPADAPRQYFASGGKGYKLTLAFRLIDLAKFLALGAALPALLLVASRLRAWRGHARIDWLLHLLIGVGLISAVLPEPTWRQYLLPLLPPLFVRLARVWDDSQLQWQRFAFTAFALAGLAPTVIAFGSAAVEGIPMVRVLDEGRAIDRALDAAGAHGPVASTAPQLLPGAERLPDRRFAAGPFFLRSKALISEADERRFHLVSVGRLRPNDLPPVVLLGGEARWSGGDPGLDSEIERIAEPRIAKRLKVGDGRLRLLLLTPPLQAAARARLSSSSE
ncbi:glycosyltransferase family 39 protein [Sphingomonas gei]|uniref:glycosyltransferase family 39 protein n=1 Tax=Sphingomonas gei TaxID=1395960 RepID=UPI0019D2325C|nr:glycosyltransferase family 39 protein [Sphingomonas gei]